MRTLRLITKASLLLSVLGLFCGNAEAVKQKCSPIIYRINKFLESNGLTEDCPDCGCQDELEERINNDSYQSLAFVYFRDAVYNTVMDIFPTVANVIRGMLGGGGYKAKARSIQERSDTFYPEHRGGYDSYAVASNKRMITFGRPRRPSSAGRPLPLAPRPQVLPQMIQEQDPETNLDKVKPQGQRDGFNPSSSQFQPTFQPSPASPSFMEGHHQESPPPSKNNNYGGGTLNEVNYRPKADYRPPDEGYGPPEGGYGPPSGGYSMPKSEYSIPDFKGDFNPSFTPSQFMSGFQSHSQSFEIPSGAGFAGGHHSRHKKQDSESPSSEMFELPNMGFPDKSNHKKQDVDLHQMNGLKNGHSMEWLNGGGKDPHRKEGVDFAGLGPVGGAYPSKVVHGFGPYSKKHGYPYQHYSKKEGFKFNPVNKIKELHRDQSLHNAPDFSVNVGAYHQTKHDHEYRYPGVDSFLKVGQKNPFSKDRHRQNGFLEVWNPRQFLGFRKRPVLGRSGKDQNLPILPKIPKVHFGSAQGAIRGLTQKLKSLGSRGRKHASNTQRTFKTNMKSPSINTVIFDSLKSLL